MTQNPDNGGTLATRPSIGKGLRLMLLGELLMICSLIAGVLLASAGGDRIYELIFIIIYALAALAGFAIILLGLIRASGVESGYRTALWVEIGTVALSILAMILTFTIKNNQVPSSIIDAVSNAAGLVSAYFIIYTTNKVLKRMDKPEAAEYGRKTFILLAVGILVASILSVLAVVSGATWSKILIAIFMIVAVAAEVVATIRYIVYLDRASNIIS